MRRAVIDEKLARQGVAQRQAALSRFEKEAEAEYTRMYAADEDIPDISSPVSDGKLLFLAWGGVTCYDARTGKKLWTQEFEGATFEASPSLAGGRLYLLDTAGVMIIAEAGPAYKQIARRELGEKCHASPAFADGRLYIRGVKHLYCLGGISK